MIEDLQEEYSKLKTKGINENSKVRILVRVLLIWLVFAIAASLLNVKTIMASFSEKSPKQMIQEAKNNANKVETVNYTLFFVSPDGLQVMPFSVDVQVSGATQCQEALEGLFSGPTEQILSSGFITHIPLGTELIDLHVSDGTAVVTVSNAFSEDTFQNGSTMAKLQILQTLKNIDSSISNVEIIVKD